MLKVKTILIKNKSHPQLKGTIIQERISTSTNDAKGSGIN